MEVGQDDVAQHRLQREHREQAIQARLRTRLVEPTEGQAKFECQPLEAGGLRLFTRVARRLRERQPGCLGGGDSSVQVAAHRPDAFLVSRGVETEPAGRANWLEQPITLLPGPQ